MTPVEAVEVPEISYEALKKLLDDGADLQLIDVRSPEEFEEGAIAGSFNIPLQELEENLSQVHRNRPIVCYCRSGMRSHMACGKLLAMGFLHVQNYVGSWIEWSERNDHG